MGVTEGGCVANGRLGHGVSMVSENVRLSPSALGVRARLRDLTDMAEVKEAAIDYPGRLRRSVEGVGVLYKTCSPATRLEDCP